MDTFNQWYARVDAECVALCGFGIDDLPDGPSWDSWADEVPADEYARTIVREAGGLV